MTALAINSVEFNFESHNIRTVIIENEPWFVAVDVCNVLGIQNPSKALKALDDDERSNFKLGRQGEANIINESGLYTLILRCRDAVKQGTLPWRFRKWVTNEVLPT
ncbi:Bro-N domain-containing protein, partial [Salmonella enterica]